MNSILYPNISRIPGSGQVGESKPAGGSGGVQKGEFDQALNRAIDQAGQPEKSTEKSGEGAARELSRPAEGLKFSAHAMQRLNDRKIHFDPETMTRINEAVTKAGAKGLQDTLVLTDKAALIISVPNRTVITAMDRAQLLGNVFTNIDGAVIV